MRIVKILMKYIRLISKDSSQFKKDFCRSADNLKAFLGLEAVGTESDEEERFSGQQ